MDHARVTAMFAAVDAMDWTTLAGFFHPAVVYERPGFPPLTGRDRVLRFYRVERPITRSAHRIDGIVIEHDRGAAWGLADCVLADGTAMKIGFADIFHFDEDMITLRRTHFFVAAV